jgi:hypothetical protein
MAQGNRTNRRGKPPQIDIDWEQFENLCRIHGTIEECAAFFNISIDTIERACRRHYKKSFAEISGEKRGQGKLSLRRKMFQLALKGDKTMLIWLSKNHIGMKDKIETNQHIEQTTVNLSYDIKKDE